MPEQELREVIAEAIYDADPLKESDPAMFQMLKGAAYYPGSIAHEAAIMQADAVLDALVARVPDGISEEIRKYGNVCWSQGFAAGAKANVEDIERHAEARQAAGMFLRALVAVARPGVTDEMVIVNRSDLAYVLLDWSEAAAQAPALHEPGGAKPWWGEQDNAVYERLNAALTPEATDEPR